MVNTEPKIFMLAQLYTYASKVAPWSSSTGETVVEVKRRNAYGIQSAQGWLREFMRGYDMPL